MSRVNWYDTLVEFEEVQDSLQYPFVGYWIEDKKMECITPKIIIPDEPEYCDLWLIEAGSSKLGVIKVIRYITRLGLKEAKDLIESCSTPVKGGISKEQAEEYKTLIEGAGKKAELR